MEEVRLLGRSKRSSRRSIADRLEAWYRAGAARVAKDLGRDGLRRLGERLGPYRGAGRTALLRRVNAWLRAAP